jgi:hypothetical protein
MILFGQLHVTNLMPSNQRPICLFLCLLPQQPLHTFLFLSLPPLILLLQSFVQSFVAIDQVFDITDISLFECLHLLYSMNALLMDTLNSWLKNLLALQNSWFFDFLMRQLYHFHVSFLFKSILYINHFHLLLKLQSFSLETINQLYSLMPLLLIFHLLSQLKLTINLQPTTFALFPPSLAPFPAFIATWSTHQFPRAIFAYLTHCLLTAWRSYHTSRLIKPQSTCYWLIQAYPWKAE